MKPVTIVIATYNGGCFLREQLLSIINSTDFDKLVEEIVVRDDGSNDNTVEILNEFSELYPLKLLRTAIKGLGAKKNFSEALGYACSKFIMTCDQDDVWDKNKIAVSFNEIDKLYKKSSICFSFCDVEVVDKYLNVHSSSFINSNGVEEKDINLNSLLVNNFAPGCSSIFSRELLNISLPVPDEAIMHDWWLILNAAAYGKVSFINAPLMKYRQHDNNTIGYVRRNSFDKLKNIFGEIEKYKASCAARKTQIHRLLGKNFKAGKLFFAKNEKTWKRKIMALILA